MIGSGTSSSRQIIPRWRSLAVTVQSRELAVTAVRESGDYNLSPELIERLRRWRQTQAVVTASELVDAAIATKFEGDAVGAARFLLRESVPATRLVRRNAALLLTRTGHGNEVPAGVLDFPPAYAMQTWRRRVRLFPEDALAWVEMALIQLVGGRPEAGKRSMLVALRLAPTNRHVIRSAAVHFSFLRERDRAYEVVRKNLATPGDPWLMAAEIALAPSAGKKPHFLDRGAKMLDATMQPRQITELAGAVATFMLLDGNRKRARKLFQQSMYDPTGNSLAQAEWASPFFGGAPLVGVERMRMVVDAREAMSLHLYRAGAFSEAMDFARQWIDEEPLSPRGYVAAAAAANALCDYPAADRMAQKGLARDANSAPLLVARVFALASQGRLAEAETIFKAIPEDADDGGKLFRFVLEANRGLLAFRRGDTTMGSAHYKKAIQGFRAGDDPGAHELVAQAQAYYAREAVLAGIPEAKGVLAEAEKTNNASPLASVTRILTEARASLSAIANAQARMAMPPAPPPLPSGSLSLPAPGRR